jgi:ribosomal protein L34E
MSDADIENLTRRIVNLEKRVRTLEKKKKKGPVCQDCGETLPDCACVRPHRSHSTVPEEYMSGSEDGPWEVA